MINSLKTNQIFVFGSNLVGNHAGGAARQAYDQFNAAWGIGEGLVGQSYAFPTLDENFNQLSDKRLQQAVSKLVQTAKSMPDKEFLLTKVGCGIAGYPEEKMKNLFIDVPDNIKKPEGW